MMLELSKGSLSSKKIAPTDSRYILEENSYQSSTDYFALPIMFQFASQKRKWAKVIQSK